MEPSLSPEELRKIAEAMDVDAYCDGLAKSKTEHAEQRAFFGWLQWMCNAQREPLARMAYAVPNGGKRDAVTAARLKSEGVKSGVPDVCWPVPVGRFAGLYIEMKIPGGSVSDAQDQWHSDLRATHHAVSVCYGWRHARDCFEDYRAGREVRDKYR